MSGFNPYPILCGTGAAVKEFGLPATELRRLFDEGIVSGVKSGTDRRFNRKSLWLYVNNGVPEGNEIPRPRVGKPTNKYQKLFRSLKYPGAAHTSNVSTAPEDKT